MDPPSLREERLNPQHNLNQMQLPATPRPSRASVFSTAYSSRPNPHAAINTVRYPPRIPRLRRPQTLAHRDTASTRERPSSISSAVTMARNLHLQSGSSIDPDEYQNEEDAILSNSMYDLHCVADEKAVDLAHICNLDIEKVPSNRNFVSLEFAVVAEDGGQYSATYNVHNVLKNDGTVYCSERCGTINILLQYKGVEGVVKSQRGSYCVLSHIVIKSPTHGYTAPCKEGMIFISHKPIDIESTRAFDLFTKDNFDKYRQLNQNNLDDTDPVAWFSASNQRQCVVDMQEKSGRYVLIKLLRADYESENMDLQYIGFVGYTGSRCFATAKMC
ncbi:hypothetical protein [Parasitella parasitica]|uniref:Uncharacterized protein n=1 Tax=Parasitella parasitica TaxID=35722 RepID=A0A0B7NR14_9FUNG|nr:hypothetical protein [Parasitella parasitica]